MSDKDESSTFLNRWSSRKQQVREEQASTTVSEPLGETLRENPSFAESDVHSPVPLVADDLAEDQQATGVESDTDTDNNSLTDKPVLTDADMPPIESLVASSDMSGFFSDGVSAALRKAALRHVFSQPQFNVRDGLNDYDGDYTVFEPLGDTITADMKFHTARKERNRLAAEEEEIRLAAEAAEEERLAADATPDDEGLADSDADTNTEVANANDVDAADEELQELDADTASEEMATPLAGTDIQQIEQKTADAADRNSADTLADTPLAGRIEKTV